MSLTAVQVRKLLASTPQKRLTVTGWVRRWTRSADHAEGAASWSVEYTRPLGGRARLLIGQNGGGGGEPQRHAMEHIGPSSCAHNPKVGGSNPPPPLPT